MFAKKRGSLLEDCGVRVGAGGVKLVGIGVGVIKKLKTPTSKKFN